jgi:deoxyribodipyrimidine photo-lyase
MRDTDTDKKALVAPIVVWFRDDLRLSDNPALAEAVASGAPVLAIFVLDDESPGLRNIGGAARWWLHGSLQSLSASIAGAGGELVFFNGRADKVILQLAKKCAASAVFWNRRYGEAERALDASIKEQLKAADIGATSFNGHLLNEPWDITSKAGTPMKVFTPYWRTAQERGEPAPALAAPAKIRNAKLPMSLEPVRVTLDDLALKPSNPDWSAEMATLWSPGEAGARANLDAFLTSAAENYGENRNRPDMRSTSRLSPHLRFGEISPRHVWHAANLALQSGTCAGNAYDVGKFLSEIGWREFSYHLLYQFPALATRNFQSKFDAFPWRTDPAGLKAWQQGKTGYPIVDAGMRELWRTGWMHNRIRMVVGSFLVKHLMIDWRQGEDWFWDTLVDADPASNSASWQWVAGSGADAAPYFRVFAPVLQGEKFDPDGHYVRHYVPELAALPNKYIHKPWEAPHPVLARAGITLGRDYPHPVVDHATGRDRALAAFSALSADAA